MFELKSFAKLRGLIMQLQIFKTNNVETKYNLENSIKINIQ